MVALASGGAIHSSTGVQVCSRLGFTRPRHGARDGGFNSVLRAVPQGQPVRDNFDAAVIGNRNIDVHLCQANVAGDSRPSFLAHPRHRQLERKAGARAHCDWQRQTEPS